MKFLPIENIVYKTHLTEDEVKKRLSENVKIGFIFHESIFLHIFLEMKPYEVKKTGQHFKITRETVNHSIGLLEHIRGVITNDFDGLTIKVKMQRHISSIVVSYIWYIFCGYLGIKYLIVGDYTKMFIPFAMILFFYVLTMIVFKIGSKKAKEDLAEIFQAEIVEG